LLRKGRTEARRLFDKGVFIQEVSKIGQEIWLSTTAGAYCFSESLAPLYNGHCFFAGSSISRIMKDREGSYWFGTLDKGVLMVPNLHTRLYTAGGEAITALASAGSHLLLAGTSMQRLLGFDTRTQQFSSLYKAPTNHEVLHIFHRPERHETFLCTDRITYLQHFRPKRQYMRAGKNVSAVSGNWYAYAYATGMGFLNTQTGQTGTAWPWLQQAAAVQGRGRWVQYLPADSLLLVATSRGLTYYSPDGWGPLLLQGQPVYASGMQQAGHQVWLTTYSQGVLLMDSSRQLRRLEVPGLPSSIYKLHVQDSLVWMLTDEGVLRYHRYTGQLRRYSVASGLPLAEYKDMRWHDGQLYLATTQGLVVFAAANMGTNQTPPLLALNQVQVNGKTMAAPDALAALASDENNLRVGFSVLAYKHVPAQVVRYRINGQAWQTLEPGVRVLYLQSLAPGSYRLQLQAFNEDGVGSTQPLQLQFRIKAPLYRQAWFWLLLGLLAMGSIYTYFKLRLRRLQRQNALRTQRMMLEQELQQSKLASIKSQMNPHFFFNALNTIQSYIYTNDKDQAAHYLNQFSELTRMVLDMSNKDLISLTEEIKALQLYLDLEALRFEGKLHYSLELSPDLQPDQFWLPPMLVQPYIENAIKHGLLHSKRPWQLRVQFSRSASGLQVVIDDNGIGRKKSEQLNAHRYRQHQSFAMSANARRLEILNKGLTNVISLHITDKTDEWGMPAGTTVALHVPLQPRISSH
ncbi:MAG: histidine kinase, partial [Chitinophagaceae bacterium]|nr:histidine kinase [Chitinophagaceae bacterium]